MSESTASLIVSFYFLNVSIHVTRTYIRLEWIHGVDHHLCTAENLFLCHMKPPFLMQSLYEISIFERRTSRIKRWISSRTRGPLSGILSVLSRVSSRVTSR